MSDNITLEEALAAIKRFSSDKTYDRICKMTDEQQDEYKRLLGEFQKVHRLDGQYSNDEKGKALEQLASYLLKVSGGIFKVERNLRTTTNEIDQLLSLTAHGRTLIGNNIIDPKLHCVLGECKNYNKKVDVTYVGKFCSLLLTNSVQIGILFSYHGITGTNWNHAAGLIKKFYLHKENEADRFCIIDFNNKHFQEIANGGNLLQIIENQMKSLHFDTDYSKFISKHPAE